jgi:GNAT superfamily N-acetyltransferase
MVEHLERAGVYLSDDEHAFRLDDDYDCSYLIVCAGEKAGALKFRELAGKIEVMQLQVHPESQGRGLGRTVMEAVMGWSKEKKKDIELSVLKGNPARYFYEGLGFAVTGADEHELHMELKR